MLKTKKLSPYEKLIWILLEGYLEKYKTISVREVIQYTSINDGYVYRLLGNWHKNGIIELVGKFNVRITKIHEYKLYEYIKC